MANIATGEEARDSNQKVNRKEISSILYLMGEIASVLAEGYLLLSALNLNPRATTIEKQGYENARIEYEEPLSMENDEEYISVRDCAFGIKEYPPENK